MSVHTRIFAALAGFASGPSVILCAETAINPDFPIQFYTGLIVTWSAVGCVGLILVTTVSLTCDLFSRSE